MKNIDHARGLVTKADHDLKIARIGLEHEDAPLDTICFHLQQVVEKLLKAALTSKDIEYPMTHDLVRLADLASKQFPELAAFRDVSDFSCTPSGCATMRPSTQTATKRCPRWKSRKNCEPLFSVCFRRKPSCEMAFEN